MLREIGDLGFMLGLVMNQFRIGNLQMSRGIKTNNVHENTVVLCMMCAMNFMTI